MTTEKQQELGGELKAAKKTMVRALRCLHIAVEPDVASDVAAKVRAYTDMLENRRTPPEPAPAAGDSLLHMMSGAGEAGQGDTFRAKDEAAKILREVADKVSKEFNEGQAIANYLQRSAAMLEGYWDTPDQKERRKQITEQPKPAAGAGVERCECCPRMVEMNKRFSVRDQGIWIKGNFEKWSHCPWCGTSLFEGAGRGEG